MDQKPVMGEMLLREGLLTRQQLDAALEAQRREGGRLGYHLIRLGYLNVHRLSQFLQDSMGLIPYDLARWIQDPSVVEHIPAGLAQFYQVVPVGKSGNTLTVAIADLDNPSIVPALQELTGLAIDPVVCPRETVIRALEQLYGVAKDPGFLRSQSGDHLFVLSSAIRRIRPLHWSSLKPDSSANDWLRTVLAEAIRMGCRTVHIRPDENALRVAFKVGDRLEERFALSARKREEMDALLAELAQLKDRKQSPRQEGRIRLQVESRFLSLHVKALPTLQGARFHLTLYEEKVFQRDWERVSAQLGPREKESLEAALDGGPGLLVVAGAAGPGLNLVYYALLAFLRRKFQPVTSLEEYCPLSLEGVSQVEVSRQEGATWPELIAVALKQEPALLACHPLRDRSSAELLFLAAAHTRALGVLNQPDAAGALRWLLKNQFRSPLRAGVLKGVLSVASIPLLCPDCRLPIEVPGRSGRVYALYTRQGCEHCLTWESLPTEEILEWHPLGPKTLELLDREPDREALQKALQDEGGTPLSQRVYDRALAGELDGNEAREHLP